MAKESTEFCKDLKQRYDKLLSERSVVQQTWDEIEAYITPYRGRFFKDEKSESSHEWHRDFNYDSTSITAHQSLVSSLHGTLTSPSIRWFELRFRDANINKDPNVAEWLHHAADAVHYGIQDSNFNLQINEVYQDVAGFGTAAMTQEEDKNEGMLFDSIPLKEFVFETTWDDRVSRFYRKLEWTPAQIISKFGTDVPDRIIKLDGDGNQEKLDVLFCVYPTGNKMAPLATKQAPSRRPFAFCYFLYSDCEPLGQKGGYHEMPVLVPRWLKANSSVWGYGPSHLALADVKSLNRTRKIQLIGSEKKIDPPVFAEERAIIGDLDLSASSLNVVRSIAGIQSWDSGFDIFVSDAMVQQLQDAVRQYFFVDQMNFPDPQAQPMTATEVQIRYEQMQKLMAPTLGRLQNDLLGPVVSNTFKMLMRNGAIDAPPERVIEEQAQYEIEYVGALARAQKSDRAASVERFVVAVGNMAGVMPEVLDVVDSEEVVRQLANDLGIPPDLLRGSNEVKQIQQDRAEAMQRAQQAELAQAEGEAAQAQGQVPSPIPGEIGGGQPIL